jgi:hypothetical protein
MTIQVQDNTLSLDQLAAAEDERAKLDQTWRDPRGILGWLSSTNHKRIGLRYIITPSSSSSSPASSPSSCASSSRDRKTSSSAPTSTTSSSPLTARR